MRNFFRLFVSTPASIGTKKNKCPLRLTKDTLSRVQRRFSSSQLFLWGYGELTSLPFSLSKQPSWKCPPTHFPTECATDQSWWSEENVTRLRMLKTWFDSRKWSGKGHSARCFGSWLCQLRSWFLVKPFFFVHHPWFDAVQIAVISQSRIAGADWFAWVLWKKKKVLLNRKVSFLLSLVWLIYPILSEDDFSCTCSFLLQVWMVMCLISTVSD